MTIEQEQHLTEMLYEFSKRADSKYRAGQKQHGGNLWLKSGLIDMALEEVIDQWMYLMSLKKQIESDRKDLICERCSNDI